MRHNFSKQREIILQAITELSLDKPHLSLEDIFKRAKKKISNISLGTVYRNIHILEDKQQIQRLQADKDNVLYELFSGPHHHFICEKCQKIIHLASPTFKVCLTCIENTNAMKINNVYTTIYGICHFCLAGKT